MYSFWTIHRKKETYKLTDEIMNMNCAGGIWYHIDYILTKWFDRSQAAFLFKHPDIFRAIYGL